MREILKPSRRIAKFRTFLPHESGLAGVPLGVSMKETGFGANTGGTAPAAANMALAYHRFGPAMIERITGRRMKVQSTLDTPRPTEGPLDFSEIPYDLALYKLPYTPGKTFMNVWDMGNVYLENKEWRDQHKKMMKSGGLHVHHNEHTLGMELGPVLQDWIPDSESQYHLNFARAHSPFRVYVQQARPGYYSENYSGKPGEEYFLDVQTAAIQSSDLIFFPTEIEREGTISAIVNARIASYEDISNRTEVVGIPVDLSGIVRYSRFNEQAEDNLRADYGIESLAQYRQEQINVLNTAIYNRRGEPDYDGFMGAPLDANRNYMTYCGRLDKEKGIFDAVMAYADYLEANSSKCDDFATFLVIGGLAEKPGNKELYNQMIKRVLSLPDHLQKYFIIPNTPMPHEWTYAVSGSEICPSEEESFNIGDKQLRAAGILSLLSRVSGHLGTNIENQKDPSQNTAVWFDPVPGDWRSYAEAFNAAQDPHQFDETAYNGYMHAQQFSTEAVCWKILSLIHQKYPGFLQQ